MTDSSGEGSQFTGGEVETHPLSPYVPGYPRADHPRATLALVLGLVAVAGGLALAVPLLLAPFAWVIGRGVVRDVDASGGQLGGRELGSAGMVLGIVGTALLALGVLVLLLFFGFILVSLGSAFS
jgi:hypothetical protein